ncbi:MAG TPA: hypothetical protein VNW04_13775 [Puia sp.]|jgi:hypothetical protein|nr:hypothetical protein [Puia sp.]
MFGLFKRIATSDKLTFNWLKNYEHRDRYFYRIKQWSYLHSDKEITVLAPPRLITMDPWPQQVFLDATGKRTVSEYVHYVASKFTGKVPPKLDELVVAELEKLMREGLIALASSPRELEEKYLKPTQPTSRNK